MQLAVHDLAVGTRHGHGFRLEPVLGREATRGNGMTRWANLDRARRRSANAHAPVREPPIPIAALSPHRPAPGRGAKGESPQMRGRMGQIARLPRAFWTRDMNARSDMTDVGWKTVRPLSVLRSRSRPLHLFTAATLGSRCSLQGRRHRTCPCSVCSKGGFVEAARPGRGWRYSPDRMPGRRRARPR